jgi:hypothetical protein
VYRLADRLDLELPGVGAVHMGVQADLRADLSAVEVVLETEEPRGPLAVSRQRVILKREGDHLVRRVAHGEGPAGVGPDRAARPRACPAQDPTAPHSDSVPPRARVGVVLPSGRDPSAFGSR